MWNSIDIYMGLIIACLPALRPYLRPNFGADDKYIESRSTELSEAAASRMQKRNRWLEEFNEGSDPGCGQGVSRVGHAPYSLSEHDWANDSISNRSDAELVDARSMMPGSHVS